MAWIFAVFIGNQSNTSSCCIQHPLYLRQRIEQAPLLTDETTLPNVNKRGLEVSNMVPCASPLKREVKPERCTMWRQQHQDAPSNKQRKCYLSLFKQILGTTVCFNLDPYPTFSSENHCLPIQNHLADKRWETQRVSSEHMGISFYYSS